MPSTKKLKRLFQAISSGDLGRAEVAAGEIVEDEAKKGHHGAARLLRGSLRPNGHSVDMHGVGSLASLNQGVTLLAGLTSKSESTALSGMMLRPRWRNELQNVIDEWLHRDVLSSKGIPIRNRLFFYGPPGCGKSLAAQALGNELQLPTYVVRFDAVIGAYLGQTAIHLRELFRFAETTPCVLLFDEVDALGKKRGNPLDVGELDRIVIAFMQELEHSRAKGMIVATSNLPQHLDPALWRRFDLVVEFPKPTKTELLKFAIRHAQSRGINLSGSTKKRVARIPSYADAEKLVESEARRLALHSIEVKRGSKRRKAKS